MSNFKNYGFELIKKKSAKWNDFVYLGNNIIPNYDLSLKEINEYYLSDLHPKLKTIKHNIEMLDNLLPSINSRLKSGFKPNDKLIKFVIDLDNFLLNIPEQYQKAFFEE